MSEDLILNVTTHDGETHAIPALAGWRIMEIIRDNALPIQAECGGSGICATCHIYVDKQWASKIPAPNTDEEDTLDTVKDYDPQRSRLSCQILMRDDLNGLHVTLAPGSMPADYDGNETAE